MEWRCIPGWPGYQINERGRVRTVYRYGMTPNKSGTYLLTRDGQREKVAMSELLALAFPPAPEPAPAPEPDPKPVPAAPIDVEFVPIARIPGFEISRAGAAAAAGLPEPNMSKVEASRKQATDRRESLLYAKKVHNNPNKRKCATCGEPTVNYRCSKCWKKIRGFGLDDDRMTVYGE